MSLAENDGVGFGNRQRDDETQAYLVQFFQEASQRPGFQRMFDALTPEEQEKLRTMS
jgi:importin-9